MTIARIEDVSALAQAFGADMGDVKPNVRKLTTDADRAPLPTDDASQGYEVGSRWQDGGREWRATDTTPGAAKWRPTATPYLTDWAVAQQAIDWLAGVGGEIIIPAGTHTLQDPLNLSKLGPLGRRAVLRGEGQSSILQFTGLTGDAIYAGSSTTPGSGLGWELRDFRIRGDVNTAMTGVFLENANSARIKRVWFERMQDAIRMANTYGARISECHATNLGRDFLRLATRTYHLMLRENGAFGIGGYFVNCVATPGSGTCINMRLDGNDVEVCGGIIKSTLPIDGLAYVSNYMEQASGQLFDFDAAVTGEITGGNTLQMSGAQVIDNFRGRFANNHLYQVQFSWGATSFPSGVVDNVLGASASIQSAPAKLPTINAPYIPHGGNYTLPSYRKDDTGRVFLNGNIRRDTAQAVPTYPFVLFTLEAGYRPGLSQTFTTVGATQGASKIRVSDTGEVVLEVAATSDVGLGGINFMAGA